MPGINEDRNRQVVPLWRHSDATGRRGELASHNPVPGEIFTDEMVAQLVAEWKEAGGLSVASDLVSAALTLGRFSVATDAAEFVSASPSAPAAARRVASVYLARGRGNLPPAPPAQEVFTNSVTITERLQTGVRDTRRQLIAYPRDPILWTNLARLYTSLGVQHKAERAILGALTIAPENRFVLRAAARFFLHTGMARRAHRLLENAACVRADPWVLASEIATAAAAGRTSNNVKTARRMIEAGRQSPFHLSELASAIGTLESVSGNLRSARPFLDLSLRDPAENAIAQAAWLSRNVTGISLHAAHTPSVEANAWYASQKENWTQALGEARRWLADQPFSSRPAMFGSFIAARALDDYAAAVEFGRQGLLSNPDDFTLRNNLAFALALQGNVMAAARENGRIDPCALTDGQRIAFLATSGLIEFRSGRAAQGRSLYRSAIDLGRRLQDKKEAIARIYYAMEEVRVRSADAETICREAIEHARALREPADVALVEKLKNSSAGLTALAGPLRPS
jgi:tetratricopeptide (TPR) repeat protein